MANKVTPKISKPGSARFPQKGPHNPNVGTHGSGIAPKPKGGAALTGNDRPSMPEQGGLARVRNVGAGSPQGRLPVQSPPANVVGKRIGQTESLPPGPGARVAPKTQTPVTGNPVASQKPRRRGVEAAFYGEY